MRLWDYTYFKKQESFFVWTVDNLEFSATVPDDNSLGFFLFLRLMQTVYLMFIKLSFLSYCLASYKAFLTS